MASKGKIEREKKVERFINKYKDKREALKKQLKDITISQKDKVQVMLELDSLPKMGASVKKRNRCFITGEARGYIRRFGICRKQFRHLGSEGLISGVYKESW